MKIIKITLVVFLFLLNFSAQKPDCRKLKLISATVQKTIPGHRKANVTEKYIFICKKPRSSNVVINNLWKGNATKGRFIEYKIMKYKDEKVVKEEIKSLSGIKKFAIVAIYKYPVDLANNRILKSDDLCPIKDFKGKAIIGYSINSTDKQLIITEIEKQETIRRH